MAEIKENDHEFKSYLNTVVKQAGQDLIQFMSDHEIDPHDLAEVEEFVRVYGKKIFIGRIERNQELLKQMLNKLGTTHQYFCETVYNEIRAEQKVDEREYVEVLQVNCRKVDRNDAIRLHSMFHSNLSENVDVLTGDWTKENSWYSVIGLKDKEQFIPSSILLDIFGVCNATFRSENTNEEIRVYKNEDCKTVVKVSELK